MSADLKFSFCPDCGTKLSLRSLGDETDVPWCGKCDKPWFPMFPNAIIALVHDSNGNILLLRQKYISEIYCNLVSGYMKPGETAEETARREILEETGQEVQNLRLVCTNWFERKNMLMIGFFAEVKPTDLKLSVEVDDAFWIPAEEGVGKVHPFPTSTSRILVESYLQQNTAQNGCR